MYNILFGIYINEKTHPSNTLHNSCVMEMYR
jgi:hypothetical protein